MDFVVFAHSVSFLLSSGNLSPISCGEPISRRLSGTDPAPIWQEWVFTEAWPIRELHFSIHIDWFRAGHMTQASPEASLGPRAWSYQSTDRAIDGVPWVDGDQLVFM